MERITDASPRVFRPKFMGRMVGVGYLVMTASGFDLFYVLATSCWPASEKFFWCCGSQ